LPPYKKKVILPPKDKKKCKTLKYIFYLKEIYNNNRNINQDKRYA
jgi:hypothetical protein